MKVSLKDLQELLRKRPKLEDFEIEHIVDENGTHPIDAGCYENQMEKWFEEFTEAFNKSEKELREKLEYAEKQLAYWVSDESKKSNLKQYRLEIAAEWRGIVNTFKEILGE